MLKRFYISIFLASLSLTAIANPSISDPDKDVEQENSFIIPLAGDGSNTTFYCNASVSLHSIYFLATGMFIEGFNFGADPKSYFFPDASIVNKVYFKAYQDPANPGPSGYLYVDFYGYFAEKHDLVCFPGTGGRSTAFSASH